ncbi:MAG: hypothetical protein AVDCRST_MAG37-406 [uncultured Rubrobacteraceae bacterium]|uniref:Uncharacterized protein n=1 Tax=uncultured Rubrobacteraceae bacterium TaxID=349277 RepID=A0A6J4PX10_9ACTN|nr:MAG: hypothetical protein AVDCRST_MAG37-406 [uncultured Rubrobacteraceae bacterium]
MNVCKMLESMASEIMRRRFPAPEEPASAGTSLAKPAMRASRGEANGCPIPMLLPEEAR